MAIDPGAHSSLHPHSSHSICIRKVQLKKIYPPPYAKAVWNFKHVKLHLIKRATDIFDLESALNNVNATEQAFVFNSTIMNIITLFVPNETVTCDDRDPPWMNRFIKNLFVLK